LGVRKAWRHPQATNHIQEMIEVIKSLIEKLQKLKGKSFLK
jgi:cysteinyl-tRNA synthetase